MAITVAELIEKLKEKDQEAVVEFVVATESGQLVCADVSKTAKAMAAILKMFKS
jgi:hypothetical protein